jgi:hypothetical protein
VELLWKPERKKTSSQDLKEKRVSLTKRSLQEILQQGARSSRAPLSGPAANSELVEISAKGRDKPMVENLPK